MSGPSFRLSRDFFALIQENEEFFQSVLELKDQTQLKFRGLATDAYAQSQVLPDGDVAITYVYPLDNNNRADDGRILLKDTFVFDSHERELKNFERDFDFEGGNDPSGKWGEWLKLYKEKHSKDPGTGKFLNPSEAQIQKFAQNAARSYSRPIIANPALIDAIGEEEKAFLLTVHQSIREVSDSYEIRLSDRENHYNLIYQGNEIKVVFRVVVDSDYEPKNGRIFAKDTFVLDRATQSLKSYRRDWEPSWESRQDTAVQGLIDQLKELPVPAEEEAEKFIEKIFPALRIPLASDRLQVKEIPLSGRMEDLISGMEKVGRGFVRSARKALGNLESGWVFKLDGDFHQGCKIIQTRSRKEIVLSTVLVRGQEPNQERIIVRDRFLVNAKTQDFEAHYRVWEAAPEFNADWRIQGFIEKLNDQPGLSESQAQAVYSSLLSYLFPKNYTEKILDQMSAETSPGPSQDYISPFAKRMTPVTTDPDSTGFLSQAAMVLAVMAEEKLLQEYDRSQGWVYQGKELDLKKESAILKSIFGNNDNPGKLGQILENGRQSDLLQALQSLALTPEEDRVRKNILALPIVQKLGAAIRVTDPKLRDDNLMHFIREELFKNEKMGGSALFAANLFLESKVHGAEAKGLIDFASGAGTAQAKFEYMTPMILDHVFEPSMIAAMMGAGMVGGMVEMGALAVLARFGRMGSGLASLIGIGGEAAGFTTIAKLVQSGFQDPSRIWSHWGQESLSAFFLFGFMRMAHFGANWVGMGLSEGRLAQWFTKKPPAMELPAAPTGRVVEGVPRPQLNRRGQSILGSFNFLGGMESMYLAGEFSRWLNFEADTGQDFVHKQFDAAIMYAQAVLGFKIANGITGGRLHAQLAELRQLVEYHRDKKVYLAKFGDTSRPEDLARGEDLEGAEFGGQSPRVSFGPAALEESVVEGGFVAGTRTIDPGRLSESGSQPQPQAAAGPRDPSAPELTPLEAFKDMPKPPGEDRPGAEGVERVGEEEAPAPPRSTKPREDETRVQPRKSETNLEIYLFAYNAFKSRIQAMALEKVKARYGNEKPPMNAEPLSTEFRFVFRDFLYEVLRDLRQDPETKGSSHVDFIQERADRPEFAEMIIEFNGRIDPVQNTLYISPEGKERFKLARDEAPDRLSEGIYDAVLQSHGVSIADPDTFRPQQKFFSPGPKDLTKPQSLGEPGNEDPTRITQNPALPVEAHRSSMVNRSTVEPPEPGEGSGELFEAGNEVSGSLEIPHLGAPLAPQEARPQMDTILKRPKRNVAAEEVAAIDTQPGRLKKGQPSEAKDDSPSEAADSPVPGADSAENGESGRPVGWKGTGETLSDAFAALPAGERAGESERARKTSPKREEDDREIEELDDFEFVEEGVPDPLREDDIAEVSFEEVGAVLVGEVSLPVPSSAKLKTAPPSTPPPPLKTKTRTLPGGRRLTPISFPPPPAEVLGAIPLDQPRRLGDRITPTEGFPSEPPPPVPGNPDGARDKSRITQPSFPPPPPGAAPPPPRAWLTPRPLSGRSRPEDGEVPTQEPAKPEPVSESRDGKQLRIQLEQSQGQVGQLEAQLDLARTSLERTRGETENLRGQVQELTGRLERASVEIEELGRTVTAKNTEVGTLDGRLRLAESKSAEQEGELGRNREQLALINVELTAARRELAKKQAALTKKTEEVGTIRTQLQEKSQKIFILEGDLRAARDSLELMRPQADKVPELEARVAEQATRIEEIEGDLEKIRGERDEARQMVDRKIEEVSNLIGELKGRITTFEQGEIEAARREGTLLGTIFRMAEEGEAQALRAAEEITVLRERHAGEMQEVQESLGGQIRKLEAQSAESEANLDEAKTRVDVLVEELGQLKDQRIPELEGHQERLEGELEEARAQWASKNEEAEGLRRDLEARTQEWEGLRQELETSLNEKGEDLDRLELSLSKRVEEIQGLQAELKELQARLVFLEGEGGQIPQMSERVTELENQLQENVRELTALETRLHEKTRNLENIETAMKALGYEELKNATPSQAFTILADLIQSQRGQLEALQQARDVWAQDINRSETELKELTARLARMEAAHNAEVEGLRSSQEGALRDGRQSRDRVAQLEQQNAALVGESAGFSERITQLETELATRDSRIQELEGEMTTLRTALEGIEGGTQDQKMVRTQIRLMGDSLERLGKELEDAKQTIQELERELEVRTQELERYRQDETGEPPGETPDVAALTSALQQVELMSGKLRQERSRVIRLQALVLDIPVNLRTEPGYLLEPGQKVSLFQKSTLLIGRDELCDVVIDDLSVSRVHLALQWNGETWEIRDGTSTYGTFLEGMGKVNQRVPNQWFPLENNAMLQFGTWQDFVPEASDHAESYFPVKLLFRTHPDGSEASLTYLVDRKAGNSDPWEVGPEDHTLTGIELSGLGVEAESEAALARRRARDATAKIWHSPSESEVHGVFEGYREGLQVLFGESYRDIGNLFAELYRNFTSLEVSVEGEGPKSVVFKEFFNPRTLREMDDGERGQVFSALYRVFLAKKQGNDSPFYDRAHRAVGKIKGAISSSASMDRVRDPVPAETIAPETDPSEASPAQGGSRADQAIIESRWNMDRDSDIPGPLAPQGFLRLVEGQVYTGGHQVGAAFRWEQGPGPGRHFDVLHHENRWRVRDLSGGQGTFVNGLKVQGDQSHVLKSGDIISAGPKETSLNFYLDGDGNGWMVRPYHFISEIATGSYTVGRDFSTAATVADPKVSAQHLEFTISSEGWQVRDLGSRYGTYVNDVKIGKGRRRDGPRTPNYWMDLKSGDRIIIGNTVLQFFQTPEGAMRLVQDVTGTLALKMVYEDYEPSNRTTFRGQFLNFGPAPAVILTGGRNTPGHLEVGQEIQLSVKRSLSGLLKAYPLGRISRSGNYYFLQNLSDTSEMHILNKGLGNITLPQGQTHLLIPGSRIQVEGFEFTFRP